MDYLDVDQMLGVELALLAKRQRDCNIAIVGVFWGRKLLALGRTGGFSGRVAHLLGVFYCLYYNYQAIIN